MDLEAQMLAPLAEALARESSGEVAGALLAEARRRRASHLHFERDAAGMRVRLRIAGQLSPPRAMAADATLSEQLRALAGARLLPLPGGERIVVPLEGGEHRDGALEGLGMCAGLATSLLPALRRAGLVLVAGTAGSGRTATLTALMRQGGEGGRHVVAIGMPPVGTTTAVSAARGQAAAIAVALGQDPDLIAIDMLQDREAAEAAIGAVEGGQLVLATIDARDAVGAIRRMREWRIEPFRLASALSAVTAQRLVRRLCACRRPEQATGSVSALLGFDSGAIVYVPAGCEACEGTGHAGRTGVFEAIVADGAIRRLINDGGDESILARHAFLRAPNLGSAARALVREGVTTPDEAVRISRG